jgi:serine/threonine protein kinase
MWSCGVILYVMLSGCYPFEDDDQHTLHHKITQGIFTFYEGHRSIVSEDAKDLIRSLLSVNPLQRLTVDQALSHPWLQKRLFKPSNPLHQRETKKHASKCTFGKIMNALRVLRNFKYGKVSR